MIYKFTSIFFNVTTWDKKFQFLPIYVIFHLDFRRKIKLKRPYLNSVMDYNIPKMEGYKIHPFNILQIRQGIVTTERHNKDSRGSQQHGVLSAVCFIPSLPQGVQLPRKAHLDPLAIKRCP